MVSGVSSKCGKMLAKSRRVWEMKKARKKKQCTFCGIWIAIDDFYWRKVSNRQVVKDLHCQGVGE